MLSSLLLLASLSFAQSSTDTEKGTTFTQDIQLTNARKDIAEIRNGRPVITGIPRFKNGICFNAAGTDCQTTSAGSSGASLTSTQTFSGINTFSGTVQTSSAVIIGPSTGINNGQNSQIQIYAQSYDGATQSSGCLVILNVGPPGGAAAGASATITFTSTTTLASAGGFGVLMEACAPNAVCRVATKGYVRVQADAGVVGNPINVSATRCHATTDNWSNQTGGWFKTTMDGGWAWIALGAR